MQLPVFIIVGKPQHGKSTVRNIISKLTGLPGGSCSDVISVVLEKQMGAERFAEWRQRPKEERRELMVQTGDYLCGIGELQEAPAFAGGLLRTPSALVRTLFFAGVRVVDGVRRRLELHEAIDRLAWCGVQVHVIHVVRPGGPEIADNTEDLSQFADATIVNDGTVEQLEHKVRELFEPAKSAEPAVTADT